MNKTFVIIVTYNGACYIRKCLNALLSSTFNSEIVIVDNASQDDTLKIIDEYDNIHVIKKLSNLGFGKANNIGIKFAIKKGASHILLLNQDAVVDLKAIEYLHDNCINNPQYGILSPIHFDWDGENIEYYFSKFISSNRKLMADYIKGEAIEAIYDVPFVNAAAWYLPVEVFKKVGGFDPIFYHYGEDNNFCQRLRYHGFKIGVVSDSIINHDSNKRDEKEIILFSEAYYLNERKKMSIKWANINMPFTDLNKSQIKTQILKQIIINTLKFRLRMVLGFYKKFIVVKDEISKIEYSRQLNKKSNSHYLDLCK